MPADEDLTFGETFADIGARETSLETDHEAVVEQTQRISHVSLLGVLKQVGLALNDSESSDARQGALDIAGSGVEEAFERLNTSEAAVTTPPRRTTDHAHSPPTCP